MCLREGQKRTYKDKWNLFSWMLREQVKLRKWKSHFPLLHWTRIHVTGGCRIQRGSNISTSKMEITSHNRVKTKCLQNGFSFIDQNKDKDNEPHSLTYNKDLKFWGKIPWWKNNKKVDDWIIRPRWNIFFCSPEKKKNVADSHCSCNVLRYLETSYSQLP